MSSTPADAVDIASLWLSTGVGDPLTEERVHHIPVGKPRDFFRTHPDRNYRKPAEIYVHKSENVIGEQFYLIAKALQGRIEEARPCVLACVVDRAGNPRLWPIMSPREGEKDNPAWESARVIARQAMDNWTKLVWAKGAYISRIADAGYAPEPDFSRLPSFDDLVRTAFGVNGIIATEEHPIYRDLFGRTAAAPEEDDPLR